MQKERMIEKLAAVKNLAQRGVGGEKETALRMYEELKAKYGISEADIEAAAAVAAGPAEEEKDFSNILFLLWVTENNLDAEYKMCRDCPDRRNPHGMCAGCSTDDNIKDLKAQYMDLKRQLESRCGA